MQDGEGGGPGHGKSRRKSKKGSRKASRKAKGNGRGIQRRRSGIHKSERTAVKVSLRCEPTDARARIKLCPYALHAGRQHTVRG